MSLRDVILNRKLTREELPIPEIGQSVWIKQLSIKELCDLKGWWREGIPDGKDIPDESVVLKSIITCVVDAEGVPVFHREEVDKLGTIEPPIMVRMFEAANKLNWLLGDPSAKKDETR